MAKANFKLIIDMNIDLPEGDTEITEKEKCAIIDRVHRYLTDGRDVSNIPMSANVFDVDDKIAEALEDDQGE